jgi:hypothetical protein
MLKLLYVFLLQSVIGLIVYKWQDPLHLCKVIIFASIPFCNKDMPIVTQSAHIGIQKSETNSTQSTVNENIKKATRALYSLMGVGLHGENGIDPETTISLLRTYVLPILYYGLEILLPTGKILEQLNIHYKKVLKQILSLYINVADPAIYILSGLLPIEAEIHIKVLTFFGNITRSEHTSIEWRLADLWI